MLEKSAPSNRTKEQNIEEFSTRFLKQAGSIYPARNADDAASIVNDLIKARGKGESCSASDIEVESGGITTNISSNIKATISYEKLSKNPREVMGSIDVGITRADYGIAETGTIVDISYTDEHRLLSSLTRVHISILEKNRIIEKLSMLGPMMGKLMRPEVKTKPSITFIGGPSRTSDIELKSVLGVHGPHEVHVILI
jgi:L-lactate utilization protein LutC